MGIAEGRVGRLVAEQNAYWNSAGQEIAKSNLRMLSLASSAGFCLLFLLLSAARLLFGFWSEGPALLLLPVLTGFSLFTKLYPKKRPPRPAAVTAACVLFAISVTAIVLLAAANSATGSGGVYFSLLLAVLPALFFLPVRYAAPYLVLSAGAYFLLTLRLSPEAVKTGAFSALSALLFSGAGLLASLAVRMRELRLRNRFLAKSRADALCPALLNKAAFEEACRKAMTDPRTHGCALLVIDLDDFKSVNDRFGHLAGDKILVAMAGVLLRHVRENDRVCRFGGDEFCILLMGPCSEALLSHRADAIRTAFREAAEAVVPVPATCSVGAVACDAPGNVSYETLFAAADIALYRAKALGRNRSAVAPSPC